MKSLPPAFVAAVLLPFSLSAQTAGGATSGTDPTTGQSSAASDYSQSGAAAKKSAAAATAESRSSTQPDRAGSTLSHSPTLSRISKASLEGQLTAKNLLEKTVYDRDGKKIGRVIDVVLASRSNALTGAFQNSKQSASTRNADVPASATTGASLSGTARASGMNPPAPASGEGSGTSGSSYRSGTGSSTSGAEPTMPPSQTSSPSDSASFEPAIIISREETSDANLLRAPLSQVSYDPTGKRLTLKVSDTELTGLSSRDGL